MSCLQYTDTHQSLHSFPTRRSSDLDESDPAEGHSGLPGEVLDDVVREPVGDTARHFQLAGVALAQHHLRAGRVVESPRSEEHTSELQSPYDLVCRLLLETKKMTQNY